MAIYPTLGPMGSESLVTSPAQPPDSFDWLNDVGLGISAAGSILSIAGTYTHLKAQQGQFKQEAMNAEFVANQANIEARAAERDAAIIIEAGQQEAAWRGAQAAVDVASDRAATAAGGVEVGTGSSGERERAIRLAAEVDKRTIRTNAERRASATREAAANARVGSVLGRATAANRRASANTISPAAGAFGRTLSEGGGLIGQWLAYNGRR